MKPKTLTTSEMITLKLCGVIEIEGNAFHEKSRHKEFSGAFVNCETDAGEIICQAEKNYLVLAPVQVEKTADAYA